VNTGTNYGTATTLVTKDDTNADFDRETFLRWDLSSVTGKIVQARVRLAGTSAAQTGNESCATFVSTGTWGETTITFANKPASGKLFAQWLPVTGQPVEFTVTPQVVETLLDSARLLSLRIVSTDNYGAAGNVSYASRENATTANRPRLILTLENTAPTISNVANQSVNEDTATAALPVVLGDDFTAVASLTVTGTSSNVTLVPNANIVLGGSGANRTVTITPAANQSGTATITLTASDGALTATDTFTLTVTAVNDAPTISNITDRSIAVNSNTGAIGVTIGDIETAATSLTLTRASSNPTLVPLSGIVLGGTGASRTVTVTPAANQLGSSTITVTVSDGTLTTSDTFLVTVTGTAIETWRFANFGTASNSIDLADANNDGEANLLEYATAQNPNTSSLVTLSAARTAGAVEITYTRSKAAFNGGMTFAVEWSDTLATDSWSKAGVTQAILADNGTVQTVKATIPTDSTIFHRFMHLKVTAP
jgi:hypothetical protein